MGRIYSVRLLTAFAVCVASLAPLAAQSSFVPANPIAPPTVSPPAMAPMPTVSPPVVTAPTGTTGTGTAAATSATSATASSTASPLSALSLLGLNSDNALLKALNGSDGDEDSMDALSSLLGSSSSATSADSATLAKILELLEKEEARASKTAGSTAKTSDAAASAAVAATTRPITSGGELVRLAVDGSSLLGGITMIVSSILAKDGSFLLTGDRAYASTTGPLSETFYFLCRKNADGTWRLYADVSQPTAYPYSYLYRLARVGPIAGTQTGDLVVFRRSTADLSADVVIRVIKPSVK